MSLADRVGGNIPISRNSFDSSRIARESGNCAQLKRMLGEAVWIDGCQISPTIQQCVQHFFNFIFLEDFSSRDNHFAAIHSMGSIFLQASVLRNIVLLSVISVSLCDTSNMDDFDSSDAAAAARRLLQKTVYNMPKLNFCELVQTKMSQMRLIIFVCSETSINSRFHMRNVRHRLRF